MQVAAVTGFARSTLFRWETGKGFPCIDDLTTLCDLYEIPVECIKKERGQQTGGERMSEQQKQEAAKIAEAVNALPEQEQDRMLAFMQGVAFAAQRAGAKEE